MGVSDGTGYRAKNIVSSIPFTELVQRLEPAVPRNVLNAVNNLRYRSQVYLFIMVKKKSVTRDQWIYFSEKSVPIGRMSDMRNFSEEMSRKGKTSLFLEFFCWYDDVWNMSKDELYEYAMQYLRKYEFIQDSDVIDYYMLKQRYVYPVYDLNYKQNLDIIKRYLDSFINLYFIGRPGRFQWNNQDHSLEMGIAAAHSILTGKKVDMESIGTEEEYFEQGNLDKMK